MAEPRDPTGQGAATGVVSPGQDSGNDRSTSQDTDGSVVSRTAHEAALAAERRRQGAEERRHQQELRDLRAQMEALQRSAATARPVEPLPDLDPNDPTTKHILHIRDNVQQWQEYTRGQEEMRLAQSRLSGAIADALALGVPEDDLDTSTPETVRASAKVFLDEKRIRDLQAEVTRLKEQSERAETRIREEYGATRVLTVTGEAPAATTVDEQIRAVEAERQAAITRGGTEAMMFLPKARLALELLQQWKNSPDSRGGSRPMPPGWMPPRNGR